MKLILTGIIISSLSFFDFQFSNSNYFAKQNNEHKEVNIKQEKQVLSFSTSVKFGKQANQLSVLISTDFDGNYSIESIKKATWKSVADKVKLAAGEEFESSGDIDISNMIKKGKPFYIAFKYAGEASADGKPSQRTWQVKDVKFSETDIANFNIMNSPTNGENVGWIKNKLGFVYRPSATLLSSEGWIISNKINF